MVLTIAAFELRRGLRSLPTYVFFALNCVLGFLAMCAVGGAFSGSFPLGSPRALANGPVSLHLMLGYLSLTGTLITAAIAGQAIHQDVAHGTSALFFTAPISTRQYLGGRYLGALATLVLVFACLGLGALAASRLSFLDASRMGPHRLASFLVPYLTLVLPNLLTTSALFFALAALRRHLVPVYTSAVVLFISYLLGANLLRSLDTQWMTAVLDPFGLSVSRLVTQYWTPEELNARLVLPEGVFLLNRVLWLAVGGAALAWAFLGFSRTTASVPGRAGARVASLDEAAPAPRPPNPVREFHAGSFLRLLPGLAWLELKETVRGTAFRVLTLAAVLLALGVGSQMGKFSGTSPYPTTYLVLENLGGIFGFVRIVVIALYAGELVWRERDARMDLLSGAMPMPDWLPLGARLLALLGTQVALSVALLAVGITLQLSQGYTLFDWGLYATHLLGLQLVDDAMACVLAMTLHVLLNHKPWGHAAMVLYLIAEKLAVSLGFEHNLYAYGYSPTHTWSDMNGFGPFLPSMLWFRGYWLACAGVLACVSYLFWPRGAESGWRWRLRQARARFTRPVGGVLAGCLLAFAGSGAFIFHNTNRLNRFVTSDEVHAGRALYEQRYKARKQDPQPRITRVSVHADLFPEERRAVLSGTFTLVNKTQAPLRTVHLTLPSEAIIRELTVLGVAPAQRDVEAGFHTVTLPEPMAPGASGPLAFRVEYAARGFLNDGADTTVVENGTFLTSQLLPRVGYQPSLELATDSDRGRQGLGKRATLLPDVNDVAARANPAVAVDADWVEFEATVGTSADQVGLAPGTLRREWTEGSRRYFHYVAERPVLHFHAFLSGRWVVHRDRWKDVAIEVLHHPGHGYNVERMVRGVKASLDYSTAAFGPYPHRHVRIVEFPRYATYAQSFPGLIPYSESAGFIARVDPSDPESVDFPFYVTSHEVAHQWWGHQVVGGQVQGAALLSETLSQYSALMVMKREYGAERMGHFLRHELDRYLMGRGMMARFNEKPLSHVESEQHVAYNKGSLVMYALQDAIGEERVNEALGRFVQRVRYQPPPFTTSLELIAELRAVTPEHLQPLITDLFERITLYDYRAVSATAAPKEGGRYEVTLVAKARKLNSSGQGQEEGAALEDWVDVGVFDEAGKALYLKKHHLTAEDTTLTIPVDGKPARAGIDPLFTRIDRKPSDNVVAVHEP
jgi:ABC-type transport system involved in multi-copper enzyme maturation permease subunit